MKSKFVYLAATCLLLTAAFGFKDADARSGSHNYAQKIVDETIRKNPDMLDVVFHVVPPGQSKNIVVASNTAKSLKEGTGDDDLGVISSGKPMVEVQKDGARIGIILPLKDYKGNTIGALGLVYKYKTGDDQDKALARANATRDNIARHIKSVDELCEAK